MRFYDPAFFGSKTFRPKVFLSIFGSKFVGPIITTTTTTTFNGFDTIEMNLVSHLDTQHKALLVSKELNYSLNISGNLASAILLLGIHF